MFELEVEIMLSCIRSIPDLLHFDFYLLWLVLLLIVQELGIVHDLTNRRNSSGCYLNQVNAKISGDTQCFMNGTNFAFDVVTDNTNVACDDTFVNTVFCFFLKTWLKGIWPLVIHFLMVKFNLLLFDKLVLVHTHRWCMHQEDYSHRDF